MVTPRKERGFSMVRFLKMAAVGLASLVLAGCFTSRTQLLDPNAAASPLASADYATNKMRRNMALGADGQYVVRTYNENGTLQDDNRKMLLNRAPELESGSRAVYYYALDDVDVAWLYGLLMIEGGAVYDIRPDCEFDQAAHDIAASEGGKYYEDDYGAECVFTDVAALKRALGRYYRTSSLPPAYYRQ
jgi:hypothetical protein